MGMRQHLLNLAGAGKHSGQSGVRRILDDHALVLELDQ